MKKCRLKTGDNVVVIAGKDKGKKGIISQVFPKKSLVKIDGVNIVKKHLKSENPENKKPNIIEKNLPIHISNVMYFSKTNHRERIGFQFIDGQKKRISKKTREEV